MRRLYLASGSPRRVELLEQVAIPFQRLPAPGIDETPAPAERATDYVQRMASEKAQAGWLSLSPQAQASAAVLGADTSVVIDGEILGKPASEADARAMLRALSAREHRVLSAVSLVWEGQSQGRLSETVVRFASLSDALVDSYVATGEAADKAGAYGIQGQGAVLIEQITGSYSGVVGLPLRETVELLGQANVSCWITG